MIGHIEGIVLKKTTDSLVVSANGVGYKLFVTPDTASAAEEGSNTSLWTHLAVRETALDLYGFTSEEDLKIFELLLSVSGIGPKSALGVLSLASASALAGAIAKGDATNLIKVAGIGKKTAEKIVLELQEKISTFEQTGDDAQDHSDTLEALAAMGYSVSEAREALKRVPSEISGSSARLREALRQLGK